MDFLKNGAELNPLYINRDCAEGVPVFRRLDTYIAEDLSWTSNMYILGV